MIPDFPKKGTPLIYAVLSKNTEIVCRLLEKEDHKYPTDEYLQTPLHHDASDGNIRMCELLIKHSKDVRQEPYDTITFCYSCGWI